MEKRLGQKVTDGLDSTVVSTIYDLYNRERSYSEFCTWVNRRRIAFQMNRNIMRKKRFFRGRGKEHVEFERTVGWVAYIYIYLFVYIHENLFAAKLYVSILLLFLYYYWMIFICF